MEQNFEVMTNLNKIITILFTISIIGCNNKEYHNRNSDSYLLENKIMKYGDIDSYMELTNYFSDNLSYQKMMPYSLKMLKSSNEGYFDFYFTYLKICFNNHFDSKNIIKLDKKEQDFLIFILNEGALNDDSFCKEVLIYYYIHGISTEKNIYKADSIFQTYQYPNQKFDPKKFELNQYLK